MAIGVGQKAKATTTAATSVTTTGVATTTGSTFVIAVVSRNGGTITSVTDNKGNTYTQIGTTLVSNSGDHWGFIYRCENGTGGAGHTATVTLSSSREITLFFLEITGADTASFDKTAQASDTASPFTSGATATTTQANELLVGFMGGGSGSNPATHAVSGATPSSGWTIQLEETDGSSLWTGALATAIVSATGAYTAGFTEAGGADGVVWIATFKEAAAGGGGQDFPPSCHAVNPKTAIRRAA